VYLIVAVGVAKRSEGVATSIRHLALPIVVAVALVACCWFARDNVLVNAGLVAAAVALAVRAGAVGVLISALRSFRFRQR
jgi:hypothetical protein